MNPENNTPEASKPEASKPKVPKPDVAKRRTPPALPEEKPAQEPASTPKTKAAPSPEDFPPMDENAPITSLLHKLLKSPLELVHHVESRGEKTRLPGKLLIIAVLSLGLFGFVVGSFSGGMQLLAAPLKIIGGLLFSALLCLPSLYIFACLGGLDAKFKTIVGMLCAMIALIALLLVGFAPVVWLFSVSSNSIGFMGALVTLLWLLCAGFGILFMHRAARSLKMSTSKHLSIWSAVFLLVTLQMPTTLRPILGSSENFLNFNEKRFFLQYWGEQLTATPDDEEQSGKNKNKRSRGTD